MKVFILCGGSGTRLWPISREEFPKQFARIFSENSLFQETVKRALHLVDREEDIVLITGKKYEWLIRSELEEIGVFDARVLTEPVGRNTAPAIALGLKDLVDRNLKKDETVLVLPSDHLIEDMDSFSEAVSKGLELAGEGYITLFGEKPTYPETGFGYIKLGKKLGDGYEVEKFEEKPDYEVAKAYVEGGEHLWNCGIFLFRLDRILRDYAKLMSQIDFSLSAEEFLKNFPSFRDISFDYAILERTDRLAIVPMSVGWNDVGSWKAVFDSLPKDESGNATKGEVIYSGVEDSLMLSTSNRLVVGIGLRDFLLINTEDVTLIVSKEEAQRVKDVVKKLGKLGDRRVREHISSYTPHGVYTLLDEGERFKIRRINLKPSRKTPMRMHHHRTLHLIVLRGTARLTLNGEETFIHENESYFVPKSTPYSIENVGKLPLELIEVQSGEYLGADDEELLEYV